MDMFNQEPAKEQREVEAAKAPPPNVPERKIADLVLPDDVWWEIKTAVLAYKTVLEDEQVPRKVPPAFLFSGPPGTGKTFAAETIAGTLGMPLHTVPITSLIQKYYGETPKAVRDAFEAAGKANAVLFFDEADSFLWTRDGADDIHYSQLVNSFLHHLDARQVPVIFATNMRDIIDPALFRRIDVMADFPIPDAEARGSLWKSVLGQFEWGRDLGVDELKRIPITGGLMHNAARAADRKLLSGRIGAGEMESCLLDEAKRQTDKMAEIRRSSPPRIRGFDTR